MKGIREQKFKEGSLPPMSYKKKWQQRGKEHRRQQEEGGEDNIDLQRDENSNKKIGFLFIISSIKNHNNPKLRKRRKQKIHL